MKEKKILPFLFFIFTLALLFSCITNQNAKSLHLNDENSIEPEKKVLEKIKKESKDEIKTNTEKIDYEKIAFENFQTDLEKIEIKIKQEPAIPTKGNAFNKAFIFQIKDNENNPLPNYPLIIRYPGSKNNDEIFFSELNCKTDEKGELFFTPENTSFSCKSHIYIYPEIEKTPKYQNEIEKLIQNKAFKTAYLVKTNLTNAGGSICLADYDKNGKIVLTNGYSTSALLGSLIRSGFTGIGNLEYYKEIDDGNIEVLLKKVKDLTRGSSKYLIYGSIEYANPPFLNDSKQYEVSLNCEIICVLLATDEELYRTKVQVTGFGNNESAALNDARNNKMNSLLTEKIIYGM